MNNKFLKIKLASLNLQAWFCILVLLIGLTHKTTAQNGIVFRDLQVNPNLNKTQKPPQRKSEQPLLTLPFFEDFSSLRSPYPNPELWQDNQVFINASFPLFPPSIGVATFDALDANGRLYEHAQSDQFGADTLTSRPIRMDSIFGINQGEITEESNVYLSFYFQPGGGFEDSWRGRAPRNGDLLILEFLNSANQWVEIWNSDSTKYWTTSQRSLQSFCPLCVIDSIGKTTDSTTAVFVKDYEKTFFKHVAIPIFLPNYLYDKFQFRFRNVSSLEPPVQNDPRPNVGGQWHLDYVRLNAYPHGYSEFPNDIAFVNRTERVLKDFQAMPAKQFQGSSDLVSEIPLVFRNKRTTARNTNYVQRVLNQAGQLLGSSTDNANIEPFFTHGFDAVPDHPSFSKQTLSYLFPGLSNPETFYVQHILEQPGSPDEGVGNDTMIQTVHFGDYYAYDDGTPERSFGFINNRTTEFACRFPLRVPDSLIAIDIWFNYTSENMDNVFFDLMVWLAQNESTPSQNPIHVVQRISFPNFDETIGFRRYYFDGPIALPTGSFFIGFRHTAPNVFLNIGFDLNNNAEGRMFSNLHNGWGWEQVIYYGSAMIRPVFGTTASIPTSIVERESRANALEKIRVFPNPSDGIIFVESPENTVNICEVYDLNGRKLVQKIIRNTEFSIELPEKSGFYILVLHTENGLVSKKVVRR